jgi:hypothetical protein
MDTWPLEHCFTCLNAICARHDVKPSGPSYVEQEMMEAISRLEKTAAKVRQPGKRKVKTAP